MPNVDVKYDWEDEVKDISIWQMSTWKTNRVLRFGYMKTKDQISAVNDVVMVACGLRTLYMHLLTLQLVFFHMFIKRPISIAYQIFLRRYCYNIIICFEYKYDDIL